MPLQRLCNFCRINVDSGIFFINELNDSANLMSCWWDNTLKCWRTALYVIRISKILHPKLKITDISTIRPVSSDRTSDSWSNFIRNFHHSGWSGWSGVREEFYKTLALSPATRRTHGSVSANNKSSLFCFVIRINRCRKLIPIYFIFPTKNPLIVRAGFLRALIFWFYCSTSIFRFNSISYGFTIFFNTAARNL